MEERKCSRAGVRSQRQASKIDAQVRVSIEEVTDVLSVVQRVVEPYCCNILEPPEKRRAHIPQ